MSAKDPAIIWGNKKSTSLTTPSLDIPDGKYPIIYVDPPWKYTSGEEGASGCWARVMFHILDSKNGLTVLNVCAIL